MAVSAFQPAFRLSSAGRLRLRLRVFATTVYLAATASALYAQQQPVSVSEPTAAPAPATLSADTSQPMEVEADHLEYDGKKRISRFSGNVQVKKGSITMRGSHLTVSDRKGQGQTGELRGGKQSAARFSQQRIRAGESIEGQAQRIRYIGAQDKVVLSGNARLRRYIDGKAADEITGSTITYSNRTGVFSVNGKTAQAVDGKTSGSSGRVRVVLTPRN